MTKGMSGLLIGDKSYIRPILAEELAIQSIDLQTIFRENMKDDRPKALVKKLLTIRRLVETVIGQLTERFTIEKVRARDLWHLNNHFIRKLLAHTVSVFLNRGLGLPSIQFELLIQF